VAPPPRRHYLDHASTTPLRPEAAAALAGWAQSAATPDGVGDPGRVHEEGRRARGALELAREEVAALLSTPASRVVFTSGGTEAVNAAVASAAADRPGAPVVAAGVEHSSVLEAARRVAPVARLEVDRLGRVELGHLADLLGATPPPALVNCQWGNHEVGTLQPVADVVALCRERGVPVHVDACSAAGHVVVDAAEVGADFLSVSAHKLGGPPGIGALVVRRGARLRPLLVGGAEERARRAGAENVPGAVGFGAAAAALSRPGALEAERAAAAAAVGRLVEGACALDGVTLVGDPDTAGRLPHIACFHVDGVQSEGVLLGLDRAGVAVHSGSSCSSETLEPSPVLAAMGADPDRSLRVSPGWTTTDDDLEAFLEALPRVLAGLRALGAAASAG